jgi:hypothetical protein
MFPRLPGLIAAFLLPVSWLAAQTAGQGASYYPVRPDDPLAVDLVKPNFAVHGDGAGDDAPAFQAAIDKAYGDGGASIVLVPEGRYRLGKTIYLWRGVRLIGYGKQRPVLVLGENTPGFDSGTGKYLIYFAHTKTAEGTPVLDGTPGTMFSGISNINIEIKAGNRAAVAVRYHIAQLCALEHMDFLLADATGGVEDIGNVIEDCRFFGGQWAIKTGQTAPGWQAMILDSVFDGQKRTAIETHDAHLTVIRDQFRNAPHAIVTPPGAIERLFIKDSRFENISDVAVLLGNFYYFEAQVNLVNIVCDRVPTLLSYQRMTGLSSRIPVGEDKVAGATPFYSVAKFTHGLVIDMTNRTEPKRERSTLLQQSPLASPGELPKQDIPPLPAMASWISVKKLGAKGDGKTDDTEVFRRAIATHRAIYVPMGNYRLTDTLTLGPETALIGLQCGATRFVVDPSTPGFTDAANPKPLLVAPQGGANILTGIGFTLGANPGLIAVKWMAGKDSYFNDSQISHTRGGNQPAKGSGGYYGIWVTDGGGGTFKNIWSPNILARNGLYISNTETEGRIYEVSVEHHLAVEVRIENAANWSFYALQTEEDYGSEKSVSIDVENSRNLTFANTVQYRIRGTAIPFPYSTRLKSSQGIAFMGLHCHGGGFPYDYSVFDVDSGTSILHREFALLTVP